MFRAMGRFFRAVGYLLTGRVDRARQAISTNPDVVRATYDRVIEEKKKRVHQYKDAVGAMIAQEEKKKSTLKRLTDEVSRLKQLRDGAAAMARKVVERHNGDIEAVKSGSRICEVPGRIYGFFFHVGGKRESLPGIGRRRSRRL